MEENIRFGVFFVVVFFSDASYGIERSPDCLCADEAGDIGQDGLTN